ncbi:unnamed protein product (macronuclear) [Paramecium tetraurelia]|uniref:Transmembrane protein n=1 Tax=Paramecium tetraurelia TaxID=5888 RepID=A0DB64_PARTE|nr:uncharacterized protein GSPATT00015175001 [Paramecium tetraurelia]CAK80281.1 unnamed protein product [Paramecium tetraurelia]|eukprot:XP_001447678.1 hypothetical protein (macronuclear) [Paramecium tetraurelia strain d4-2]
MLKLFEPYYKELIFLLSQFLKFEFTQPQIIQILLIIVNQVQPISFNFYHIYNPEKQFEPTLQSLLILTRPYLFIVNEQSKVIVFSICFTIQQIIILMTIYLIIQSKRQQYHEMHTSNVILRYICNYYYLVSSTFFCWLIEICMMNITEIYGIILEIIMILEIAFIIIFSDIVFQSGLILRVTTQLPLNNNQVKYFIKPLRIFQIMIFFFLTNSKLGLILQNILIITIQTLHIYQILELKIYAKTKCVLTSLIIASFGIIIPIESLIVQNRIKDNLWLLLSLILICLLHLMHKAQCLSLQTMDLRRLKYLFSYVESLDGNHNMNMLKMTLIICEHQQNCQKCECICKKEMNIKQKILQLIEMKLDMLLEQRTKKIEQLTLDLSQILFRRRQFVKAQQVIFRVAYSKENYQNKYNSYNLSLTTHCLLDFLKYQIENDVLIQMMERMILTNPNNKLIADSLKQFSINENSDQYIQMKLKKTILDKSQFYYYFIEHSNKFQGDINYPIKIIRQLQQFRIELTERYQKFPTSSNQNVLKFYLLEVLNDYIEAFDLNKNKALNDEKYQLFHDSVYNKLFGQNPSYIVAEINKDLDVIIVRQSKKAMKKFQSIYGSKWKNSLDISVNDFIPEYVQRQHRTLIEQFFDEGTNKYYQQQNLAFLKLFDKIMLPIEMMVGLNQSSSQTFSFLIFFYEQMDYRSYLVVNQSFDIINCSENISNQILGNNQYSTSFISTKNLGTIFNIIPEFDLLIQSNVKNFFNHNIRLLSSNGKQASQRFLDYFSNINIEKRFTGENLCYMITLDNIRSNNNRNTDSKLDTSIFQKQQTNDLLMIHKLERMKEDIDEDIEKAFPYQEIFDISLIKKGNPLNQSESQHVESKLYITDLMVEQEQTNPIHQQYKMNQKLFSPKESMNEEFITKKQFTFQNETRDFASGSSITMIKKSKFYKKFEIIYSLCKSLKSSSKLMKANINFILFVVLIQIYIIINLSLISNIRGFIQDIKLLSVRYDVTGPLESFSVSRFTQINYKEMLARKAINATYAAQLQIFPKNYLMQSFDKMKKSMGDVLLRSEIDQISNITYMPIMLYVNTNNTGQEYNISKRSIIIITLNYQYDFKLHLDGQGGGFDNPYYYFTYKDYQIVKSMFDHLNVVILDITLERSNQEKKKWMFGYFPFWGLNFLITLLIILQQIRHSNEKSAIMKYISSIDLNIIEQEKLRLSYLQQIVVQDMDVIKAFVIDIDQVDNQLEKSNIKQKQFFSKKSNTKLTNNKPILGLALSIGHFLLFTAFSIYLFWTFRIYFLKYEKTAAFYQQLSDLGVDIPAVYAQKEILFRVTLRYPFLNSTDLNQTYAVIFNALNSISRYQQQNLNLSSTDYLFDEYLIDFFTTLNTGNLCEFQSDELKQQTESFCPQVMQGNLVLGFQQSLIYILNSVRVQQSDTLNFTVQPTSTLLELEGSTILTNIIEIMKEQFYNNLVDSAQNLILNQQLLCIFYLTFEIVLAIFYFAKIDKYNYQQFLYLKQSVYLFPRHTLIFDDSFYRNFRSIVNEENLLD